VDYWENIPLFETQKKLPDAQREQLRVQRLQNSPNGLANSLRGMGTGVQPSLWDDLHKLNIPVALIAGEQDTKFVSIAQNMHRKISHSTLHIVRNAGHTIHLEQAEKFAQILNTL